MGEVARASAVYDAEQTVDVVGHHFRKELDRLVRLRISNFPYRVEARFTLVPTDAGAEPIKVVPFEEMEFVKRLKA
jgi:hypothetical protein